jgi:ribosomal-protein-alanine N-acetyltransferase
MTRRRLDGTDTLLFAIPDISRTLIGTVGGFRKTERPEEFEVGYSVLQGFQGKGYATEGTKALIDWALARSSLKTISAQTFRSLPKSIRVMAVARYH